MTAHAEVVFPAPGGKKPCLVTSIVLASSLHALFHNTLLTSVCSHDENETIKVRDPVSGADLDCFVFIMGARARGRWIFYKKNKNSHDSAR